MSIVSTSHEYALTAVVLTFNEAANIARCLDRLTWLQRVVIVDSGSSDGTLSIASRYHNVEIFHRPFDHHAAQWNYALTSTRIDTAWVLCLDADYIVPSEFVSQTPKLLNDRHFNAYRVSFDYLVAGRNIGRGLYGDVPVLLRRGKARFVQRGHTQRAIIEGKVGRIDLRFHHDDRKSMAQWWVSQYRYATLEAAHLAAPDRHLDWRDTMRVAVPYAPTLCFAYLLIIRGMLFKGRAARQYAYQRLIAESLLRLKIDAAIDCRQSEVPQPVKPGKAARTQGGQS